MYHLNKSRIAIVGLGYVGLPLAIEFGKSYQTIGYDINSQRVKELIAGKDRTREFGEEAIKLSKSLTFTGKLLDIAQCNIFIVTVPTPVDNNNSPDLDLLRASSRSIGSILKKDDIVIYESTVYPGATEEVCIPLLEKASDLVFNTDFFVGYSPERINPGDKHRSLTDILKITSGSTPDAANFTDELYNSIIKVGTHKVSSIKVAEAAKVIENVQRDVNIALVNELALIFSRLGIDTLEVLQAAGTKWNFLPFRPGLVGGHCIGVDPYYLVHKARETGFEPSIIPASRRINEMMASHVVGQTVKLMAQKAISVVGANVLVMGLSFKENCPDLRNTKVVDIIQELKIYNANIDVYDPWVEPEVAKSEYGLELIEQPTAHHYDAVIIAVAHREFIELGESGIEAFCKKKCVVFDVKYLLPADKSDGRL